jgi:hypothetical protein
VAAHKNTRPAPGAGAARHDAPGPEPPLLCCTRGDSSKAAQSCAGRGRGGADATTSFPWSELPADLQERVKGWFGHGDESGGRVCTVVENWCRTHHAACADANGPHWDDILERLAGVPPGSRAVDEPTESDWSKRRWFEELCGAYSDDDMFRDIVTASKKDMFLWQDFPNLTGGNHAWLGVQRDFVRWMAFAALPSEPHEVRLTAQLLPVGCMRAPPVGRTTDPESRSLNGGRA